MASPSEIHLINPLWGSAGGSALRTIELYRELAPHTVVNIWTEDEPAAELAAAYPIRRIELASGHFPRGGTLVFVGVYRLPGAWIAAARPRRTIVVYNIYCPDELLGFMRHLFGQKIERVEVVYASELLRQRTKLRGTVENSLIDLHRFVPRAASPRQNANRFVVGRLSRDDPRKHHPDDLDLYHRVVEAGCQVRIMGGHCLVERGSLPAHMELLPVKAETAEAFLQSLDCFLYRTDETWWETFGRVIFEAMACGLPVVCHRQGGYVSSIDHCQNGFLFETNDEALAIIRRLQNEPDLQASIGAAARAAVETMYSPAERAKIVQFYLA